MSAKKKDVTSLESDLRSAFGVNSFTFIPEVEEDGTLKQLAPIRIEVQGLRISRLPEISDSIVRLLVMRFFEEREWSEIATYASKDVLRLLDPLVSVPEFPAASIGDLPIDVLADCLRFVIRSVSPGKWQALGKEAVTRFGIAVPGLEIMKASQKQNES